MGSQLGSGCSHLWPLRVLAALCHLSPGDVKEYSSEAVRVSFPLYGLMEVKVTISTNCHLMERRFIILIEKTLATRLLASCARAVTSPIVWVWVAGEVLESPPFAKLVDITSRYGRKGIKISSITQWKQSTGDSFSLFFVFICCFCFYHSCWKFWLASCLIIELNLEGKGQERGATPGIPMCSRVPGTGNVSCRLYSGRHSLWTMNYLIPSSLPPLLFHMASRRKCHAQTYSWNSSFSHPSPGFFLPPVKLSLVKRKPC